MGNAAVHNATGVKVHQVPMVTEIYGIERVNVIANASNHSVTFQLSDFCTLLRYQCTTNILLYFIKPMVHVVAYQFGLTELINSLHSECITLKYKKE